MKVKIAFRAKLICTFEPSRLLRLLIYTEGLETSLFYIILTIRLNPYQKLQMIEAC